MKRSGRKSAAQTPAPKKERIVGSFQNPKGSASSEKSASQIVLSVKVIEVLKNKRDQFNDENPSKKVELNTLKAVMRRGMGAYSSTHRPTITGGKPNSRQAWGYARVNKFLQKKAGEPVKKAYVQDDDLIKAANGTEIPNSSKNMKHAEGGKTDGKIALPDTYASYETLKPILAKQGYELSRKEGGIITLLKNKTKAPKMGSTYGQDVEPTGYYAIKKVTNIFDGNPEYETVKVAYSKPLFIDVTPEKLVSWKYELSHKYNAKGKRLTDKLLKEGYDIIITRYPEGDYGEIIVLDTTKIHSDSMSKKYTTGGELPSTDPSTWDAVYQVGDRVKIRKDFRTPLEENKIFTIQDVNTALGSYAQGIGMQRPENPSGRLYQLSDNGGNWEGKDLQYADAPVQQQVTPQSTSLPASGEFGFKTPTGQPTRLTYLQQVLVRTKGFKDFFGDWETAAKDFLRDGRNNFERHYEKVSKVLDYQTLEPRVVFHGTRVAEEFYQFDVTKEKNKGRPYGYFAHNREYSMNFTTFSQGNDPNAQPFLYECFLRIVNPFHANTNEYVMKTKNAEGWMNAIIGTLVWDKYKTIEKNNITSSFDRAVRSQIEDYVTDTFGNTPSSFWLLMARDNTKDFKAFLNLYKYDGILYGEEYTSNYDPDNPAQYTLAETVFNPSQIKLADGRNLDFDRMNNDIRFRKGGMTADPTPTNEPEMNKKEKLSLLMSGQKFAEGGTVLTEHGATDNGKKGGYFKGRSHADGGIKAINVDTGQLIEVEGEEVIITKNAVNDTEKREFEGEMLTNREILSRINQSGGGVAFKNGGELEHMACGCSGKKFKFGGELVEDFNIIRYLNDPQKLTNFNIQKAREFVDSIIAKMQ